MKTNVTMSQTVRYDIPEQQQKWSFTSSKFCWKLFKLFFFQL